ncbi:TonB-dependent receptor [Peristeroidobacter soli]|uniref:TonB-dependent receptor n=1 Tax=Peristeroidobacter soli TaxID=2497877 RepID=UPI00101CA726|nr:TonB-dependent receptor [Peristeroidobacter soli]
MKSRAIGQAVIATVGVLAVQTMSFAQELEEVIVTAQKRAERLIDVPISLDVLSGEQLEQRRIETMKDLAYNVPGLTLREDGPGTYQVFIRGLANHSGTDALVGMYLDEVPLTLTGFDQVSPAVLDYQRVEILKGPQGTLYGQGSAAGTVRFISNDPKLDALEGRFEAETYDVSGGEMGGKGSAVLNVPLVTDRLAWRFAGSYQGGGGWQDQPEAGIKDGNGTELLNVRSKLLWQPTEEFSANLMIQVNRAETKLGMGYEEPDRTVDVGPDRSKVLRPKTVDFELYNLTLNYDAGFAKLISATSYIDFDHHLPFTYIPRQGNLQYGYVEGNDDRAILAEQFSQEVRLASSGGPFEWTLGAFYRDLDYRNPVTYEYEYTTDGSLYQGGGIFVGNLYYFSHQTARSYSLFADGSYSFNEHWTVGTGVRYFEDKKTSLIEYSPGTGTELDATFHSVDPRAYVRFKPNDETTLYLNFAKGFRSGGFNQEPFAPYQPEKVFTYELGVKGSAGDGLVQYDFAGFLTNYEDMIRRRMTVIDGAFLSESRNIGKVRVKGVEAGLTLQPADGLSFYANGAWLDSEMIETDPGDQVNVVGDSSDYTPKFSWSVGGRYEFSALGDLPAFVSLDYNHRDEVAYIDRASFLPQFLPQWSDAIDLVNVRAGLTVKRVDLEVFVDNLTNQNKWADPYHAWANADRTRPRMIGIKAGYSF